MKVYLLFTFLSFFSFSLFSQSATLSGSVLDKNTGEPLIGAFVKIIQGVSDENNQMGAITDMDGKYTIQLPAGIYIIEYSFVSFQKKRVENVNIKAGEIKQIHIILKENTEMLSEVEVVSNLIKNTQSSVLFLKKKSLHFIDGVSSEQFALSGANDAAAAAKQITGISIEKGKYIYVRGLGDRYSKVSLNGSDIPGLDPNRNTVQMDLFPSALIDNIIVYKNFSPEFPADFSGGYVNINTKDFPDFKYFQISTSIGVNTQAHFNNDFLTYEGGGILDDIGIDNGVRKLPASVSQDGIPSFSEALMDDEKAQELTETSKAFNKIVDTSRERKLFNKKLSVVFGDKKEIFGKQAGFIVGLSYQQLHRYYGDGKTERYQLSDTENNTDILNANLKLKDQKSASIALWGAIFHTGIKLNNNNMISWNLIYNNSGNKNTRYQEGNKPRDDNELFYQTRALLFERRSLLSNQLKGEHLFSKKNNIKLNWISSYTISMMEQPDFRFFTNGYRIVNKEKKYEIEPSVGQIPTRYWRNMKENNIDNKIHLVVPFNKKKIIFKVGLNSTIKSRVFRENQYRYNENNQVYNGNPVDYIADENIWTREKYNADKGGVYIEDAYQAENNFNASQYIYAGYAMLNISVFKKLKITTGIRLEKTNIYFTSLSENIKYANLKNALLIDDLDFLPALSFNYQYNENNNFRFSYGRTLARPTFRELAPLASFDFIGDFILIGNPELEKTLIDNIDLRWESFPKGNDFYSISLFYKNFINPIEKSYNPRAVNAELMFRNVSNANLYGIEVEVRKNLGFIHQGIKNFFMGVNVAYIYSMVHIAEEELNNIRAVRPSHPSVRSMFGQSPYIINSYINYKNSKGTIANISFNLQGDRLVVVMTGGTPNVYERPFASLNFSITQSIHKKWQMSFRINNILNSKQTLSQTFKEKEYIFQSNTLGTNFSLGLNYTLE